MECTGAEKKCMLCGNFRLRVEGRTVCQDCDTKLTVLPGTRAVQQPRKLGVDEFALTQAKWLRISDFPESLREYVEHRLGPGGTLIRGVVQGEVKYMHKSVYEDLYEETKKPSRKSKNRELVKC